MRVPNVWVLAPPAVAATASGAIAVASSSLCGACLAGPPVRGALAILGFVGWAGVTAAVGWNRALALVAAAGLVGSQAALWTLPALGPPCPLCAVVFGLGILSVGVLSSGLPRPTVAMPVGLAAFLAVSVAGTAMGLGNRREEPSVRVEYDVASFLVPQCGGCRRFAREALPQLETELGPRYRVYWLLDRRAATDVLDGDLERQADEAASAAAALGVTTVPATYIFRDGRPVERRTGVDGIVEWIRDRATHGP